MLAAILALSLLASPVLQTDNPPWIGGSDLPLQGEVTYYAPGLMEWVYEYRLRLHQVPVCDPPQCVGYVALPRPGDLGRKVWLQPVGLPAEGPFLVVDYASQKDFERLRDRGWVAEVDYQTAWRWGMLGPLSDVQILPESPLDQRVNLPLVSVGGETGPGSMPSGMHTPATRLWLPVIVEGGS